MKTLAEMTPEERAQCLGIWAEFKHDGTTELVIIRGADPTGVDLFNPLSRCEYVRGDDSLWDVTPRPDLPRAWNADGTPAW